MRPKIFFVILLLVQCFLLMELAVPAGQLSLTKAVAEYQKSPSDQNKRYLESIKTEKRFHQRLIAGAAAANLAVMVLYAWKRKL